MLKDVQHDMYMRNVGAMFQTARRALAHADAVLGAGLLITEKAKSVESFDHRVLQDPHDIIAAAYRHEYDDGGQLQLWPKSEQRSRYITGWSNWFQDQLVVLVEYPQFVRAVVEAVLFSNSTMGYIAEHNACDVLITHYSMEDWAFSDGYVKTYARVRT